MSKGWFLTGGVNIIFCRKIFAWQDPYSLPRESGRLDQVCGDKALFSYFTIFHGECQTQRTVGKLAEVTRIEQFVRIPLTCVMVRHVFRLLASLASHAEWSLDVHANGGFGS